MSKSFNIDLNSFNNTNDMDSIYAGNIAPATEVVKQPKPVETKKETKNKTTNKKSDTIDHTKTKDNLGRVNKKNNYAIQVKIDEDLKDFISKIEWVMMLDERTNTNKNKFINDLIRKDMLKRLKLDDNASYEETQKAWDKYKKANNI